MLFGFFDVISFFYALRSLYVLWRLFRNWNDFWDAEVTSSDRSLANEIAFFVLIPLGVFLHEAGHALATWQVGGQVLDFQWRVFWGFIVPAGDFSPIEDWWISFSGPLVSILIGLLPILLLPRMHQAIGGELLYAFIRHELFYALVWYPGLSFTGFGGDWITIYNFSIAPYAHMTLILHLLLLYSLWRLDKSDWVVRWRIGRDPNDLITLQKLEANLKSNPGEVKHLTRLANFFQQMGEYSLSQRYLKQAEKLSPNDTELKVTQALFAYERKRYRQAQASAKAALAGNLSPETQGRMHSVLAWVHMDYGERDEALKQFDAALHFLPKEHILYYWRAVVKRSLGRKDEARHDLEQATLLAPDEESRVRIGRELETLR